MHMSDAFGNGAARAAPTGRASGGRTSGRGGCRCTSGGGGRRRSTGGCRGYGFGLFLFFVSH
jgi:hypothetical protein